MDFDLKTRDLTAAAAEKCDLLVLLLAEGFSPGPDALSALAAQALADRDLRLKAGEQLHCYRAPQLAARQLVLAGAGDGAASAVRKSVLALGAALKNPQTRRLVLCFAQPPQAGAVAAALQAVAEASYVYTTTKPKAQARSLSDCLIAVPDAAPERAGFERAVALVAGLEFACEWANRPANHATPSLLAEAAQTLAKLPRMQCTVYDAAQVRRLGMGAFLAVARGSDEPLRFIELRYRGAAKEQAPIVLVGKGVTFDSGGISIKAAAEMDEMKFDMCGAASVLGVFRALGQLQPALNVVGLIPACENLPDGRAVKPGDVVTSLSGQTIEILNTDAEGRLILCDALSYAARFKPAALIDIATLTGACIVALARVRSALYANDEALAGALYAAGEAALDPCWRMPLDDEYAEGLKSNFADLGNVNSAGRAGGSVSAAKFLQKFVGDLRWAHLDIAGAAWRVGQAKGATGRPVGLLLHYLLGQAGPARPARADKAGAQSGTKTGTKTGTRTKAKAKARPPADAGATSAARPAPGADGAGDQESAPGA